MKSSQPTLDSTESANAEQELLLLPGYLFFIETIDVPEELNAAEVSDFAELSLESIAPFPIDQLNWGYLYREGTSTLLLYAAHRDRLKKQGYTNLTDHAWVLPDFATLAGARFDQDTLVALKEDNHLSLLYFEKHAEIPKSAWVTTTETTLTEEAIHSAASSIPGIPATVRTLPLDPPAPTLNEHGLPSFKHTAANPSADQHDEGAWQTLTPTEAQLWQMDVRSVDFKAAERSKRRTSALIGRIFGWAVIFVLLLAGAEGVLFAARGWLENQLGIIDSQRDAVAKVEEQQILVNKLEQVAQNELRPIEILEAANNIRLKLNLGIEYDSVIIDGENHITIEGKASSINALNRYVENLKGSGLFELLVEPENLTRAGKTTFKVSLAYTPGNLSEEPAKEAAT